MSVEALQRTKAAAVVPLPSAPIAVGLELRDSGRGVLHLVHVDTGAIVGVGTDAAVLGRTRDFFRA